MKIAIHDGSGWNKQWVLFCKEHDIDYEVVDCYSSNIISKLKKFDILLWHFHHAIPKDILMARNVLYSAERMGLRVFPNFNTCWHFDDKVSQKYLLEAINAPVVPSWAFYDKKVALKWLKHEASYPLVAKLRRGAGSYNVKLIYSYSQARAYAKRMFGKGVLPTPGFLADGVNKLKVAGSLKGIINRLKKAPAYFKMVSEGKSGFPKEKGYVYFQSFIPDNKYDIRVSVVGSRAWAFKRKVRSGDFRASGSGVIDYNISDIPLSLIEKSLEISKLLQTQSIAFDYVTDSNGSFFIVEISYGFIGEVVANCGGYWDDDLNFHKQFLYPEKAIITDLIDAFKSNS